MDRGALSGVDLFFRLCSSTCSCCGSGERQRTRQPRQPRPAFITHGPKGASFRCRHRKVYTTPPRGLANILYIYIHFP